MPLTFRNQKRKKFEIFVSTAVIAFLAGPKWLLGGMGNASGKALQHLSTQNRNFLIQAR
jgi:hypothetical protein